jgi:hypothetical protein
MQPVLDFLATPHGVIAAVLFCAFAAGALFRVQALAVAERKWCGDVAHFEAALGLSDTMTAPWSDLASGDIPGFVGAMKAKIKYLADRSNREKEVVNVLRTLYATPSGKAAIDKAYADLAGGATAEQLQADVDGVVIAAPKGPGLGPVATDVANAVAKIEALTANPALANLLHLLPADQGILGSALLTAGHAVGAAVSATGAIAPAAGIAIGNVPADHTVTIAGPVTPPAAAA